MATQRADFENEWKGYLEDAIAESADSRNISMEIIKKESAIYSSISHLASYGVVILEAYLAGKLPY